MFGVDPQTIRRYIANQKLNAYRVGPRLIRVRRDEKFDALLTPIGGAA